MCLITFAWRPGHATPLVLAANRDEFYERPARALGAWHDVPGLHAGRDLEAGGTWLGLGQGGRFAALTNIRDPRHPATGRTRGELCVGFLGGTQTPEAFMAEAHRRAADYAGFNLLVGDGRELWFLHSRGPGPRRLEAGLYGLSNADLDTPWPKVRKTKAALAECLDVVRPADLLNLMHDPQPASDATLPDTGVGLETERMLSPVFIASRTYGTRATTALIVRGDGSREVVERGFGPFGKPLDDVHLNLRTR